MTSLAYLHDCHCCYNERSFDPKKKEAVGPGYYTEAELEERLFVSRSNRPGDDTKDAILGKASSDVKHQMAL